MSGNCAIFRFVAVVIFLLPGFVRAADEVTLDGSVAPVRISIGQTLSPEEENRTAEVEGTVTFIGNQGRTAFLEISSESGSMPVTVTHGTGVLADLLLKSRVRVHGICTAIHSSVDGKIVAGLLAANANDITILQVPEEIWQRYPLNTINALAQTNFSGGLIHLRGKIQSVQPGISFSLADKTGGTTIGWKPAVSEMAGTDIEVLCGWRQERSNRVLHAVFFRPLAQATSQKPLPTLTLTEQIRWLNPDEAQRQYPVKVCGVVTFVLSSTNDNAGNIQDGSGGIYVWNLGDNASAVKPGDFCQIEGVTVAGAFSPGIHCRKLTVLGPGEMPNPIRPTWTELVNGALDAQWVEIQGVVLSATGQHLEIGVRDSRVPCFVSGAKNLEHFSGAVIRVRGVVVEDYDYVKHVVLGQHLNIPSPEFISVEAPALADASSLPVKPIADLLNYSPDETALRQEKVRGEVIGVRAGVCYLTDGTNGLRIILKDPDKVSVSDDVEAVGFPEVDSSEGNLLVTLHETMIHVIGHGSVPIPQKISAADLLQPQRDSTLIQTESRLVNMSSLGAEQVLELQSGSRNYLARLQTPLGKIPQLPPDSKLQITGVYTLNNGAANGRWNAGPFELLLNSSADVRILELPSWWTARHAAMVVGGMTLTILFGAFLIAILHQQVNRRTIQLSKANRSLQDEISERKRMENELVRTRLQHLVEQERTRIARDIHDELGCNLSQIRLLSEMTLSQNNAPSEIQANTGKISAKALETTRILDEIVWAVDPHNDTLESLLNYLFSFASDYFALAGIRFRIDAPTNIPLHALTTQTRHQLYMAVKEMLANIVNHSRATEVRLRLILENDVANFEIADNGCGFKFPGSEANPNASGLDNMRRRFQEIGGEFDLQSGPGCGTRIRFTLPLKEKTIE